MKQNSALTGHLAALCSAVIWGTTFIATKILLMDYAPLEILALRFALGFAALWIFCPRPLRLSGRGQEKYFMVAGLCGVTLYFLLENIALTYTFASNVGIILAVAPFFTALSAHWFLDGEALRPRFFLGFASAIAGVALISFNGSSVLKLNPMGDLLAVLAAAVWAVYSTVVRKISAFGYPTVQTTRRAFFYGLLFMIPAGFIFGFSPDWAALSKPQNLFNLLYLGLGASALCFVTWNFALRRLGAVKTCVYIYIGPVITVVTSALILHEPITWMALLGMCLALAGLFLSEDHRKS